MIHGCRKQNILTNSSSRDVRSQYCFISRRQDVKRAGGPGNRSTTTEEEDVVFRSRLHFGTIRIGNMKKKGKKMLVGLCGARSSVEVVQNNLVKNQYFIAYEIQSPLRAATETLFMSSCRFHPFRNKALTYWGLSADKMNDRMRDFLATVKREYGLSEGVLVTQARDWIYRRQMETRPNMVISDVVSEEEKKMILDSGGIILNFSEDDAPCQNGEFIIRTNSSGQMAKIDKILSQFYVNVNY